MLLIIAGMLPPLEESSAPTFLNWETNHPDVFTDRIEFLGSCAKSFSNTGLVRGTLERMIGVAQMDPDGTQLSSGE
jgi:hypothetical protein